MEEPMRSWLKCAFVLVVAATMSGCVTLHTHMNTDQLDLSRIQEAEDCQLWLLAPILTVQDRARVKEAVQSLDAAKGNHRVVGHEDILYWYVLFGQTCVNAWVEPTQS
jgi:hypothetical protein